MPMTVRDIIVIGASLGGFQALCQLLEETTGRLGAALLVVLHTSPKTPRYIVDMLSQCTRMKVSYGEQGLQIERGHIYIAPPDHHMTVIPLGYLRLDQGPKAHFTRPAADPLFCSAADFYGPRVIGVVLTGGGNDGTAGLRKIKASGGVAIVQDPDEATAPQMPMNALIGDSPDFKVSQRNGESACAPTERWSFVARCWSRSARQPCVRSSIRFAAVTAAWRIPVEASTSTMTA
jgi:two-component system, chemotaxis family, protein-glutamate methylesterase/glutaminase